MKRLAFLAAVLVVTACTTKTDETAADTAAPAMAPAPATTDTGMGMTDTTKMDTTKMGDTTKADTTKR